MSAGTGVRHSEFNASQADPLHFLQIWIEPAKLGIAPGYQEKSFSQAEKRGQLRLVASRDGRAGSVTINADAVIHVGLFDAGENTQLALAADRHVWVHAARGNVRVNGVDLSAGDAVAISSEPHVQVEGISGGGELLIFELA
jgi:redox-sensitive bicupin YhaK (pirin superfamily)